MNHKLFNKLGCVILLFALIFPTSCQKKQLVQIPPPLTSTYFEVWINLNLDNRDQEKKIIEQSGINYDYRNPIFYVGIVTNKQFLDLKHKGIQIYKKWEWRNYVRDNSEQPNKTKNLLFLKDPYLNRWNERNGFELWFLSRFYQDINTDGIPELFLPYHGGSSGNKYSIYQITKEGYYDLGIIHFSANKILSTSHYGFSDIMIYRQFSADDGRLLIEEFNGFNYEPVKEMFVIYEQAFNEKVFVPDKQEIWEEHPDVDKLIWSPKDDEQYRRMIK